MNQSQRCLDGMKMDFEITEDKILLFPIEKTFNMPGLGRSLVAMDGLHCRGMWGPEEIYANTQQDSSLRPDCLVFLPQLMASYRCEELTCLGTA